MSEFQCAKIVQITQISVKPSYGFSIFWNNKQKYDINFVSSQRNMRSNQANKHYNYEYRNNSYLKYRSRH